MDFYLYKTGERCPCCGQPIKLADPVSLELFSRVCFMAGLTPWALEEDEENEV